MWLITVCLTFSVGLAYIISDFFYYKTAVHNIIDKYTGLLQLPSFAGQYLCIHVQSGRPVMDTQACLVNSAGWPDDCDKINSICVHAYHIPFIHSCYFYIASSRPLLLRGTPNTARIQKRHRQQGPCVAARAGFEPTTLWMKGNESTNEPPRPTLCTDSDAVQQTI